MKRLALALLLCLLSAIPAAAAARFAVCTTTCTWDNASTAMWSATTGGATGASAPTSADTVTLDAATCVGGTTCTITVNANLSISSLTMGACTASTAGCILDFSANNNNITVGNVSITGGAGTRTLNMGNGTWTITTVSSANAWNATTTTGLTFAANASTLIFSASATGSRTFTTGGLTFWNVSIIDSSAVSSGFVFIVVGNITCNSLSLSGPLALQVSAGSTITPTVATNWAGSSGNEIYIFSNSLTANFGLAAAGGSTMSWVALYRMTATGSPTATNSFDLRGNSGITITAPGGGGGGSGAAPMFGAF